MNISDEDHSETAARGPRRTRIAVGAVAAAAVLGGGAYVLTSRSSDTSPGDVGALAPIVSPSSTPTSPSSPPSTSPAPRASSSPHSTPHSTPSPTKSESAADVREQVMAAREKAAKDGVPLQRPLTAPAMKMRDANSYAEESRPVPGGGTMRVMSAKYDLSGQHEMLWAADQGHRRGDASCTQNFHFSPTAKPAVRPTMLLCWRTSADRSVVVLTVAKSPSESRAVDAIDQKWGSLG